MFSLLISWQKVKSELAGLTLTQEASAAEIAEAFCDETSDVRIA
jgi:hypothetical protein